MLNWRAAPARSTIVRSSRLPEHSGVSRTGLAAIATGRIVTPVPHLDPVTELAREAVLDAIRRHLQSWLDFFSSADSLSATGRSGNRASSRTR